MGEVGSDGGGEQSHGGSGAEHGIEVDTRPNEQGSGQGEQHEGRGGEAERQLRGDVGEDVVVDFVLCRVLAVGGEEEGAHMAAEI